MTMILCFSFPLEMHIVHMKVGEPDFLKVKGGLAVTGFFFEVRLMSTLLYLWIVCYSDEQIPNQVDHYFYPG